LAEHSSEDRYSPAHREYYIIEKISKSEKAWHAVRAVGQSSSRVGLGSSYAPGSFADPLRW